jgi:hypothetical protein
MLIIVSLDIVGMVHAVFNLKSQFQLVDLDNIGMDIRALLFNHKSKFQLVLLVIIGIH